MRFGIAVACALMASQAGAVNLECFSSDPQQSICRHFGDTSLPYSENHLDAPGTFDALVSFASPLSTETGFSGYAIYHYDIYNPAGDLIDGNTGPGEQFLDFTIPAGLTGFSFRYTVPEFDIGQELDFDDPSVINKVVRGNNFYFELFGNSALPKFTFGVSSVAAVPEPASWAMMIAGFGAVGVASRYRKATVATA